MGPDARTGRWPRPGIIVSGLVVVVFAVATWVYFLPLGLADSTHLPECACSDQALQVWFLAADHYAVVHHQLSLLSTRLDYPAGVNLMDNTSMPLLGLLTTPLFGLVGPVGVFVLLLRVGYFLSATSCFFVLRRYVRSVLAAAVGAGAFAFGPFLTHQAQDHVFLVFLPIPPILLLITERHVFAGRRRYGLGVALGLLAVAQYFISSEVLVATVLLLGLTVAILGAWEVLRRRPVWPRLGPALPTLGVAAAVTFACLAYPAWYAIHGPQHIIGPSQQPVPGIDLLSVLAPVDRMVVAGRWPGLLASGKWISGNPGDMAFIGVPLLAICAAVVVTQRRRRIVAFAAVLGLVAWVLALGPRLLVHGHDTGVRLPFALLDHIPVLADLIPSRLMLFDDLAAAILLAVGVDRLLALAGAVVPLGRRVVGLALATGVAALGLAFVMPTASWPVADTPVAALFLDGRVDASIPSNGVVLAYPYPVPPEAEAMIWQADSGLRFSLLGGYALRPWRNPSQDKLPPMLDPPAVLDEILGAYPAWIPGAGRASLVDAETDLPAFVARYHVTTIVVDPTGEDPGRVVSLCRAVYGPPVGYGQLLVWPDLHRPRTPTRLVGTDKSTAELASRSRLHPPLRPR